MLVYGVVFLVLAIVLLCAALLGVTFWAVKLARDFVPDSNGALLGSRGVVGMAGAVQRHTTYDFSEQTTMHQLTLIAGIELSLPGNDTALFVPSAIQLKPDRVSFLDASSSLVIPFDQTAAVSHVDGFGISYTLTRSAVTAVYTHALPVGAAVSRDAAFVPGSPASPNLALIGSCLANVATYSCGNERMCQLCGNAATMYGIADAATWSAMLTCLTNSGSYLSWLNNKVTSSLNFGGGVYVAGGSNQLCVVAKGFGASWANKLSSTPPDLILLIR